MAILEKALIQAHEYAREITREGDTVVDATMGNGNDTLFLARLVGPTGKVYAFDIQSAAIDRTREKLEREGLCDRCELICDGHENLDSYVKTPVRLVMFNLGYLPGGSHSIGTRAETTIEAIEKSLSILRDDGLVIIVVYYGGDSGFEERDALLEYLGRMDCRRYSVMKAEFINQINCPPFLICIEKNLGGA
jgi:SAM-dependent methyltransferase